MTIRVQPGHRHVCPKCPNVCVPAIGLTARPECNNGHASRTMRPA